MTCLMLLYPQLLLLVLLLLGHTQHALSTLLLLLHSTQASLLTRMAFYHLFWIQEPHTACFHCSGSRMSNLQRLLPQRLEEKVLKHSLSSALETILATYRGKKKPKFSRNLSPWKNTVFCLVTSLSDSFNSRFRSEVLKSNLELF